MPKDLTDRIAGLLAGMHGSDDGRAVLARMGSSKFELANDATYDIARKFFSEHADLLVAGSSQAAGSEQKERAP